MRLSEHNLIVLIEKIYNIIKGNRNVYDYNIAIIYMIRLGQLKYIRFEE